MSGFRYAYSLTHHRQDAEDLVQEACLRVFRAHGDFRDKAYLFTTIRNLFFDENRRRKLPRQTLPTESVADKKSRHADSVMDKMDLDVLLSRLTEHERELLFLSCAEGFTAAELSQFTGQPRGTVLSQLSRAKKKLAPERERIEGKQS
ncbi:sigma-70 family RNA polymerase sigma factor [Thalassoglobus sp. JC818]|uniref:RNA polymerase sigma factor n=1 Tax=Thalassoglobus sp. JC818 TaxID=3232136 RepID=UPI0034584D67